MLPMLPFRSRFVSHCVPLCCCCCTCSYDPFYWFGALHFSSLKLFVLVFFEKGAGSSLLQCVLVFFRAVCSTLLVLFHYSLLCCALSSSLTCLSLMGGVCWCCSFSSSLVGAARLLCSLYTPLLLCADVVYSSLTI